MFTKPDKKNFLQYENNYKKSFLTFFKFLISETKVDETKRKFVLECFERFKEVEEYDSTKEFVIEVFEEIGFQPFQNERLATEESDTNSSDIIVSEISVPLKIDLQQMYLLQLFQRALALNISIGTSNKRIFGIKIPFMNDYAFFVKTLCLGTVMVIYKNDGRKCVPEIIQLDRFPEGWKINKDKTPVDGITVFDFYQDDFKKKRCFMGKRIMKKINPILFGTK
ncbi:hypothetical protein C1645_818784 [Glomus cerebriforme]|uniref:Uncharacterized protein n=1 Tax=Glomus cerebriforme TaxID=658196 RepID=A0A397TBV3_9GLOM|nr:hypothetical protein C1645_818784 [Glomus cerebriforme]